MTPFKMAAKTAAILDFTRNPNPIGKMRKLQIANIFARVVKHDTIKHFAAFDSILYVLLLKKGENTGA